MKYPDPDRSGKVEARRRFFLTKVVKQTPWGDSTFSINAVQKQISEAKTTNKFSAHDRIMECKQNAWIGRTVIPAWRRKFFGTIF